MVFCPFYNLLLHSSIAGAAEYALRISDFNGSLLAVQWAAGEANTSRNTTKF